MKKHCGNCANQSKGGTQLLGECGKCVAAILENGERTDPSHWRAKPKTNADRIRAMTDEELAEFLCGKIPECIYSICPGAHLCNGSDGRANGLKKWLQQPAEGD